MCACLFFTCTHALALDVGFNALLQLEASDNIEGANAPLEEQGVIQSAVLGVYGEQRSRRVTAGFLGELDIRNTSTDEDDSNVDAVSQFLGAAEFRITPRSWTWYVGDILGGVRSDDALQPIDDAELQRRNVFVTGPAFEYEQLNISRTFARALYVFQTQENETLETLYSASFRHERDLTTGSFYGIRLGNIFTDLPSENAVALQGTSADEDFNRATLAVFYQRAIGFLTLFGEVGATRYNTNSESLDGFNAELRATQELAPQTSVSVFIRRDLSDQSLSAVESLVQSGEAAVGITSDAAGFFAETAVGAQYSFESTDTVINLAAGVSQLDFELLTASAQSAIDPDDEDRVQAFASATWSERLSPRLRSELSINFESQDFDNIADNSESLLLGAQLVYSLTRSFELQLGFTHDNGSGFRTRFTDQTDPEADNGVIDVTENRVAIGLRWAPPSRASQDLTVELKSLLQ